MKLFNCDTEQMTFTLVDLPRSNWRHLGPRKWQVVLTIGVIIVSAVVWGLL